MSYGVRKKKKPVGVCHHRPLRRRDLAYRIWVLAQTSMRLNRLTMIRIRLMMSGRPVLVLVG